MYSETNIEEANYNCDNLWLLKWITIKESNVITVIKMYIYCESS